MKGNILVIVSWENLPKEVWSLQNYTTRTSDILRSISYFFHFYTNTDWNIYLKQ